MIEFFSIDLLFLKKKEVWFYNGTNIKDSSYTSFSYSLVKPKNNRFYTELTTRIDLNKEESEIKKNFSNTIKNELSRCKNYPFEVLLKNSFSKENIKRIIEESTPFFNSKKLLPINYKRLVEFSKMNKLLLTTVKLKEEIIVTHVYLIDEPFALLLYSFSNLKFTDSKIRGYANKYLHWEDIKYLKKNGSLIYDFGGIEPEKNKGISDFKLAFGGTIDEKYSFYRANKLINIIVKIYRLILG